ncbi:MAG TPA: hypothetical protein VI731_10575 [Bacteroidia bacterium]|nr:hypothetical protein [Bacteroidia bacterium]
MIKYFTELHLGSLVLRDPATGLTNILIFLAGWLAYRQLKKTSPSSAWRWFFIYIGISSLVGVIVHCFSYYTPEPIHFWIWITMGLIQNFGITCAQIGTAQQYFKKYLRPISMIAIIQFTALGLLFIFRGSYEIVKLHTAIGLVPVMIWYLYRGYFFRPALWIGFGILFASISGIVHSLKLSFSPWFNYNDIAHVVLVVSLLMMGKGLSRMEEKR